MIPVVGITCPTCRRPHVATLAAIRDRCPYCGASLARVRAHPFNAQTTLGDTDMDTLIVDGARHAAVLEYARRLLRQADAPDLDENERAELLAEAHAAEARAFAIREGRG